MPLHRQAHCSDLIIRVTGRTPGALAEKANLEADLGLSSLDRVELLRRVGGSLPSRFERDAFFPDQHGARDLQRLVAGARLLSEALITTRAGRSSGR